LDAVCGGTLFAVAFALHDVQLHSGALSPAFVFAPLLIFLSGTTLVMRSAGNAKKCGPDNNSPTFTMQK
jgi:hypothetical protein